MKGKTMERAPAGCGHTTRYIDEGLAGPTQYICSCGWESQWWQAAVWAEDEARTHVNHACAEAHPVSEAVWMGKPIAEMSRVELLDVIEALQSALDHGVVSHQRTLDAWALAQKRRHTL